MSKSTDPIPVFVFSNLKSFAPIYHDGVIKCIIIQEKIY